MQRLSAILDKITALEGDSRRLEPQRPQRLEWEEKVRDYAQQFLDEVNEKKAYVAGGDDDSKLADLPIQDEGRPIDELIQLLSQSVDSYGINPASGGHLGYIPGGGIYPTALGDYLADIFNRYSGVFFATPGAVRMENLLIRWMNKLIGFPASALGNLTSGGSIANLIAIVAARDAKGIRPAVIEKSCIYLTEHIHHSLQKAIRIAGLATANLRYVGMDSRFRMDVEDLQNLIRQDVEAGLVPFLVIASSGTTDTGAVDPLDEIATICRQHNLWYHIDGAYGGFFILADEVKHLFKGIEKADSVTIDPHKGMFLSYGSGAVLIKDVAALQHSHHYEANYMQDALDNHVELSPADLSPELTKHFRGLRMWLPMQLFGLKPFKAAITEKIWLCRYFYLEIQKLGFEVGPEPDLSVCIYRYIPEQGDAETFNKALVKAVQQDGTVFISSTKIAGRFWLRLAVVSFRSHLSTIKQALSVLEKKRDELLLVR
jgi:glutamate/tyrosine decarboxylase-like PLP-dependent enzyme